MKRRLFIMLFAIFFCSLKPIQADEVVLTVTGLDGTLDRSFTEEDIRAMPVETFTTFDPWEKKQRTYTGCRISDFLEVLDLAKPVNLIHVIARDEYNAKISELELQQYVYILSYEMDGKDYSQWGNSDKGPIAIMVKMEDVKYEDKVRVKNQMVLWVKEIVIY